ncbi:MAG TPA: hypothetical protein DEQ38_00870 [Elusimicrobia bacterium]|nr:MAG: hypothetical protein A2089_09905 [Elusimicrobia bacterium GWD2_63_28]HCC46663.1 hypothetical protein [Elusimicrobiota bacterium]
MKAALCLPLLAALLAAPLPGRGAPAGPGPSRPNFVVIVIDALRPDHMSLYGSRRRTTPRIDAFSRGASVFTQAISQAPTTLLSFASLFTSMEVSAHGVSNRERALGDSALTLAEILRLYNYKTGAFLGGHSLHPVFRLDRGFDEYYHVDRTSSSFSDTLPPALAWAEERQALGEPFLLLVHGNDLHTPYVFPPQSLYDKGFKVSPGLAELSESHSRVFGAYRRRLILGPGKGPLELTGDDVNHLLARYDEGVRYADGLVGAFLEDLRGKGILDGSVVVITADHGEGLFDHDYFFHDFSLYDEVLRVPLLIRVPGGRGSKIGAQVRLMDLLPTLLDFAGIPAPEQAQGRSLKPLTEGRGGGEVYSLSEGPFGGKALRTGRWKLLVNRGKTELFDLRSDPRELRDLAAREPAIVEELRRELEARLSANGAGLPARPLPYGAGFPPGTAEEGAWYAELFRMLLDPEPPPPASR